MNADKYTLGPWSIILSDKEFGLFTICAFKDKPNGGIIGNVIAEITSINQKADGFLISAAPDLLEALAGLLLYNDVPTESQDPVLQPLLQAGFDAIAKATRQ